MNPDQNNQQNPPPEPQQPTFLAGPPIASQPESLKRPKNYKKVLLIVFAAVATIAVISIIVIVIIMTILPKEETKTVTDKKQATEQSSTEKITSGLVESADREVKLTDTDDTQAVKDASKAAGNVENGVNEANF